LENILQEYIGIDRKASLTPKSRAKIQTSLSFMKGEENEKFLKLIFCKLCH
jgi:hypothetical protein